MAETLLIGIGFTARAGKDTFGWMLVDELRVLGVDARRYAFADALKAVARVEHGMREKDARLLQRLGLSYREGDRGQDVWLNACLDQIAEEAPQVAVLTDVRFENEAQAVTDRDGLLIKVSRPGFIVADRDAKHVSETALADWLWPIEVVNNGTLRDLNASAERIVEDLILPKIAEGKND